MFCILPETRNLDSMNVLHFFFISAGCLVYLCWTEIQKGLLHIKI